jgi:hypothetical protein
MTGTVEKGLADLGRHVTAFDGVYVAFALAVVGVGVGLALLTGQWEMLPLLIAVSSFLALGAKKTYTKSLED